LEAGVREQAGRSSRKLIAGTVVGVDTFKEERSIYNYKTAHLPRKSPNRVCVS
jgi:hypothetical protein